MPTYDDEDDALSSTGTFDIGDFGPEDTDAAAIKASGSLVCLIGPEPGRVYTLSSRPMLIGRGPKAGISLEGTDVSRDHARITWNLNHFVIEDLQSRNGTAVNGVPIRSQPLRLGDRIQVGTSTVLVYAQPDDLERRALRLQKLDALAQLAAGMVHDFKNVLAVVLGNVDYLEHRVTERYAGDGDMAQCVADLRNATAAATELTQRLLYFARRDAPSEAAPVGLRTMIDEIVAMLRRTLSGKAPVEVAIEVDPALLVLGTRSELVHALLNLALNARDAMPGGGKLSFRAERVQLARPAAMLLHLPAAGAFVELSVIDTGTGMDDATLARAFEPFFTTKQPGEGTGLGLATVYGVVRNHGGNILVDSTVGGGTTFRLLLPAASTDALDMTS